MKKSYILSLCAAAILATGCSKEDPFGTGSEGEGQFLKSALAVDLNPEGVEYTRTRAEADVEDFNVIFTKEGEEQPTVKYRYGDMPEVVTLPAGTYTCTATYGENRNAEWESPYFLGVSQKFEILPMEITSYVEPIICNLENIKVTVDFDQALRNRMSADSYVEVKVGTGSSLKYTVEEANAAKAGYFMHSEEISLVAVFHGTIDGAAIVETKSMTDIRKGAHYNINFKLHNGSESDIVGDADLDLSVDASVTVVDVNRNVSLGEEELLDDSERPKESDPSSGGTEDPQPGPGEDPKAQAPTITAQPPVDLNIVNDGTKLESCILNIHSDHENGITELVCDIYSPALSKEELQEFGLDTHLDLVNTPEEMQSGLQTLGLPYLVEGQKDVVFDISNFITILGSISEGQENQFVITVKDANGSCTKTLKIKF